MTAMRCNFIEILSKEKGGPPKGPPHGETVPGDRRDCKELYGQDSVAGTDLLMASLPTTTLVEDARVPATPVASRQISTRPSDRGRLIPRTMTQRGRRCGENLRSLHRWPLGGLRRVDDVARGIFGGQSDCRWTCDRGRPHGHYQNTMTLRLASFAAAATALLASACSYYGWTFAYDVTLDETLDVSDDVTVVMASNEFGSDIETANVDGTEQRTSAEQRITGQGMTCCSPSTTISLFAFADLNDNDTWDEGEPWGEDPNNPVDIERDGYVATIVIDNEGVSP